jgi:hypothetical protein
MRHLLSAFFLLTTTLTLHAQPPSYVPTDGLVGWWPFNGNANDESGNGNDGTVNGATLTPDRNNIANSAFGFSNSTISVPHNSSLGIEQSSGHTISLWAYMTGTQNVQHLVGKRPNGSQQFNWQIAFNYPANVGLSYGGSVSGTFFGVVTQYQIPINQWIHVVGTYNANSYSLYINGVLILNESASNFYADVNCPLTFGNSGGFQAYNGTLDDIGIWNRALTPAEIQALYTGQGSSPCVSPTAVSFSGLATSYTTSDGPATLTGTPAGGVFIGPGVTGSTFSPAVAGEGIHSIQYVTVDNDGCVNSAGLCTSVSLGMGLEPGGNAPGGVRVFPNPNRGQFTVELELAGLVGLQVFDARGALVHNEVFTASGSRTQRTLDLSAFAKGSYTLLVEHDGQRVSQAVVVE